MRANDTITLICYALSLICIIYITAAMHIYFRKKYREGVVGIGLVLGMLMFTAYALERLIGFVIRFGRIEGWSGYSFRLLQDWGWTIGVIGTTVTLCALAILVQGRDLGLFLERPEKKKGVRR
ncbi:hypothetical protein MKX70_23955 [Paenibacillus sp. FSL R7-0312]|uniref:hypothetical protein n=1 Tax=unclassified Paenibacillus TaxID=185978 RepID=UPI0030F7C7F4